MKYCKHCGRQLSDDTLFCPSCGTRVEINNSSDYATSTSYAYNPNGADVTYNTKVKTSYHMAIIILLSIALGYGIISFIRLFGDLYVEKLYEQYHTLFRYYSDPRQAFMGLIVIYRLFSIIGIGIKTILLILSIKKRKYEEHFSTGLAVCILLFGSIIAGILAFIERSKK